MSNKTKTWRKVEQNIADTLDMKRIAFSGGIWPNKEDAEDLDFIVQAKTTDGKSVSIKAPDINALVRRSLIQHKVPLFVFHIDAVEFDSGKTWVAIPLDEFQKIKEAYYDES